MPRYSAIVLGGGMSGLGAAYDLARAGWRDILVVEQAPKVGGLAGSFEREGRFYPLGYHHILHRDRTLLHFLEVLGLRPRVHWRTIRMLFEADDSLYDLGSLRGMLQFPMRAIDKARLARLVLHAYTKSHWTEWEDRAASELVDEWAGPEVRRKLFDPLCQLKFQLPSSDVSAAWLGARLNFREGASPLGFIPDANWTTILCDGMAQMLESLGVELRVSRAVSRIHTKDNRVTDVELDNGERCETNICVSTLPTHTYLKCVGRDDTRNLAEIRYTALVSAIAAAPQMPIRDFYWLNLTSRRSTACAIFMLSSLNPTIGRPGEMCINFVSHLRSTGGPTFTLDEPTLLARYLDDFERVFGTRPRPTWTHVSRVASYSPIFVRQFRNPPVRSATWRNVYFAGNYRTFPSVASTGTALQSGLDAGAAIRHDCQTPGTLP